MAKKKELLAIGATAASCAAAAAGYSLFNNEKKPDHPNKKLIEPAKDTIVEKEAKTASAAFEYDEPQGDIIGGEAASIYRGPSDNATIQQWRDTATINQKSGAPSDRVADVGQNSEKSGAPKDRMDLDKSGAPKDVADVGQLTDRLDVDKNKDNIK